MCHSCLSPGKKFFSGERGEAAVTQVRKARTKEESNLETRKLVEYYYYYLTFRACQSCMASMG